MFFHLYIDAIHFRLVMPDIASQHLDTQTQIPAALVEGESNKQTLLQHPLGYHGFQQEHHLVMDD